MFKTLQPTIIFVLTAVAALSGLCAWTGCASYHLGSPTPLPFESIYIRPVANDSFAAQAQAPVSAALRQAFIRDGRVRVLSSEAEADVVLDVRLTDYTRNAAARREDDTALAESFNLILSAGISLFDQNRGDYLFRDRPLSEETNSYLSNPYTPAGALQTQSLQQAEYQVMPILARGLARQIADEVLSPWPARETK